jgi:hypothetical protein
MSFFRSIIIFPCTVAILLAGGGSFLAAAEAPPTVRTELRVAATDIVGEHHTLWLRTGVGSDPVKLQLNVRTFTETLQHEGPEKSGVYATEADARAEEPAQPPLLTLSLAGGSKMFVFLPDGPSYRALTIPEGDFPYGSIRLANLAKALIHADLGKQSVNLAPGASKTFSYQEDQPSLAVSLFSKTDENGARIVRRTNWSVTLGQRELVVFYIDPNSKLVRTHHLVDTRPPESGVAATRTP